VKVTNLPAADASTPADAPGQPDAAEAGAAEEAVLIDEIVDPPDEPPAETLSEGDVSRLAGLETEVLVIDGRPRYHLSDCTHLAGKDSQPLPVSEAVELGFTACSRCGVAQALLAGAASQ
jgi:hypothetical protein